MGGSYVDVSIESENKDDLSTPCEHIGAFKIRFGHNALCIDDKLFYIFLFIYMYIERQTHMKRMSFIFISTQKITDLTILIVTFHVE